MCLVVVLGDRRAIRRGRGRPGNMSSLVRSRSPLESGGRRAPRASPYVSHRKASVPTATVTPAADPSACTATCRSRSHRSARRGNWMEWMDARRACAPTLPPFRSFPCSTSTTQQRSTDHSTPAHARVFNEARAWPWAALLHGQPRNGPSYLPRPAALDRSFVHPVYVRVMVMGGRTTGGPKPQTTDRSRAQTAALLLAVVAPAPSQVNNTTNRSPVFFATFAACMHAPSVRVRLRSQFAHPRPTSPDFSEWQY